jgi:light-independent protochlorophyllide reductase subunit B
MFRGDFEFHDGAAPSHLGTTTARPAEPIVAIATANEPAFAVVANAAPAAVPATSGTAVAWAPDAERELAKIPFFVRGKARRNTERFAQERAVATITVETLYDAKAHFGR